MIAWKQHREALFALIPAAIAVAALATYYIHGPFNIYINTTNSMPRGVYIKANIPIGPGTTVIFPSSVIANPDPRVPMYLLKKVLPYHGELVTINHEGLFFDSTLIARREINEGIDFYRSVLPPGWVLVIGESERSYDSRYFGPVKLADLFAARPLLTW
jgi:type IV secretory pathway protease TraF